ncbi:MAG: radical SAM protein [Deltaproteobacteria bacterium]|jgi:MoaA/NifB/PqqE/SkfB family radical SAM enzyme|nr:radical SAM protein [Deltaproteobacteria bacterium]
MKSESSAAGRSRESGKRAAEKTLSTVFGAPFAAYRKRFREAVRGKAFDFPAHLDVDITTRCDLNCPMCPGGKKDSRFPGMGLDLDPKLYDLALRECEKHSLPSLRIGVTGEPTLVRDLPLWVETAKKRGVSDIALITNGRNLDRELSEKLAKAGLARLMISVDAATPETYEKVRPGGDFRRLAENIRAFLRMREELKSPLPVLRLSYADFGQGEKTAFRELFSPLADYLSFQRPAKLTDARIFPERSRKHENPEPPPPCPEPFARLALHASGTMFPCCSDFGRLKPVGTFPDMSIGEAWNGPASARVRGKDPRSLFPCGLCFESVFRAPR